MNRPSRTDEPQKGDGYNQSPDRFANDLTTNQDLNGISNARMLRRGQSLSIENAGQQFEEGGGGGSNSDCDDPLGRKTQRGVTNALDAIGLPPRESGDLGTARRLQFDVDAGVGRGGGDGDGDGGGGGGDVAAVIDAVATVHVDVGGSEESTALGFVSRIKRGLITFVNFIGPGFMIAVAYIDPGNYSTDVAAGASYQYRLLFVVLLSNLFAIFLQSLSIKLGTVTGLNLAEACRAFLPRWLNYVLYFMAEAAIIATDLAEVIGTAIALNLLIPRLPLVAGCALSILDVMVILIFYQPKGSMRGLRAFEYFVVLLVLGVVVCFCLQLSLIKSTPVGEILIGYVPSATLIQQQALYQACGVLGATVMPHSLYLGSGIVQSRLRQFDAKYGLLPPEPVGSSVASTHDGSVPDKAMYIPSLRAIRHSLKYSIAELTISLFTFALFVNSAILIVAGASLYGNDAAVNASIFGIHDLLAASIAPAAGTVFALALLLSGISAGIVCTLAGQMVSEGALNWTMKPWLRRLITRAVSITPSIIVAAAVGREGLDAALNASQVALSIVLPFVTAPLIYFTCRARYMTVQPGMARYGIHVRQAASVDTGEEAGAAGQARVSHSAKLPGLGRLLARIREEKCTEEGGPVNMANSWFVTVLGVLVWLVITALNVANLVLLGQGSA